MEKTQRYIALDVLRGLTVAMMILVNNPGNWSYVYAPLLHSQWNGCTPTDLVFPFFLFVVGVSLYFSFNKYNNSLNRQSLLKIGRRTVLIFLIGLFLNSFPQWMTVYSKLRIMGVLQRIALAYGIGALIILAVKPKILPYLGAFILLLYWGLIYFIGSPDPYSLQNNITTDVDSAIFGVNHLYTGFGIPFDPEGILNTLPALVTVIIGYQVGKLIKSTDKEKVPITLLFWGIASIIGGLIWNIGFPINKALWSSSYVLYTAGWAILVLSLLVWIIDLRGKVKWAKPFQVFGMNPLFLYALSELIGISLMKIKVPTGPTTFISGGGWIYNNLFFTIDKTYNGSLLFAIMNVVILWLIGYVLYKRKIFIKV